MSGYPQEHRSNMVEPSLGGRGKSEWWEVLARLVNDSKVWWLVMYISRTNPQGLTLLMEAVS